MAEEEGKKKAKPVVASAALVAATKRVFEGKGTNEDNQLVATASDAQRRAARKEAGVKTRRGGFRSKTDMWVKRTGDESAKLAPKSDWKAIADLKKEVHEHGKKITVAFVPHGQKP